LWVHQDGGTGREGERDVSERDAGDVKRSKRHAAAVEPAGKGLPLFGCSLAGAVVVTGSLRDLLFGLTPLDPGTYVAVAVAFGLIAVFAAAMPARRATKVNALEALRYD
jgi:hypothetical protein